MISTHAVNVKASDRKLAKWPLHRWRRSAEVRGPMAFTGDHCIIQTV